MPLMGGRNERQQEPFFRKSEARIFVVLTLLIVAGVSAVIYAGNTKSSISKKVVEEVVMNGNDDDICTFALAFGATGTMATNMGCPSVIAGGDAPAICSEGGSNIPVALTLNGVYNVLCGAKKVTTLSFESSSEHPYSIEGSFPAVMPETLDRLTLMRLTNAIGYSGVNILGPLPASVSVLTKLKQLYLDGDSELESNIPNELCDLSELTRIVINNNEIDCSISQNDRDGCILASAFGTSSSIYTKFKCDDPVPLCSEGGAGIPDSLTNPYLINCGSKLLTAITFDSTAAVPYSISGSLPSSIPNSLDSLTSLSLTGTDVSISGPIPASISVLTKLKELYLDGTGLDTNVPTELCALTSLTKIEFNNVAYDCSAATLNTNDEDDAACAFASAFGTSSDIYTRMECSEGAATVPICSEGATGIPSGLVGDNNVNCGQKRLKSIVFESDAANPYTIMGSIPSSISSDLNAISTLRLTNAAGGSGINVLGPIPYSISTLTNLQSLFLDGDASLTNNIPTVLCDMTNLVTITLNGASYACTEAVVQVV